MAETLRALLCGIARGAWLGITGNRREHYPWCPQWPSCGWCCDGEHNKCPGCAIYPPDGGLIYCHCHCNG